MWRKRRREEERERKRFTFSAQIAAHSCSPLAKNAGVRHVEKNGGRARLLLDARSGGGGGGGRRGGCGLLIPTSTTENGVVQSFRLVP